MSASAIAGFVRAHVEAHPEDGWTLGLAGVPSELALPLPGDAAHCRAAIDALALATDVDADAVLRAARFHLRYAEQDGDASNLELAALPNAMLQHGALHAKDDDGWEAVAARAASVPAFLAQHAANLRRGVARGRGPDAEVARAFVERILPGAADAVAALPFTARAKKRSPATVARVADGARAASEAYRAFAEVVAREIAPRARPHVVLGADETAFRLADVMGVTTPIDELLARARDALAEARSALDRAALMAVLAPRPATLDEALAGYRRFIVEATNFVRDRELVPIPARMALALEPLPPGIADGGSVTNWPAPLFDPEGDGHVLYATDPGAHATIATKNLAVHEGVPGHYLQSVTWQRQAAPEHACRYLGVADDVAFARGFFGTTIAVEGWAVHMEQLLRTHGFYDTKDELLFFAFCDGIRAVRVVLDLALHTGVMDADDAVRFVADATTMPEGWARAQVLRSKRIPLQGLTYLVGQQAIAELRRAFRGDDLDFHARLLALGPVPPSASWSAGCWRPAP